MDKILLIDGLNSIHRANVSFGPPSVHEKIDNTETCACKSPWNSIDNFCYGQKYLLIFNFFRNLRPIIEMFSPDKCYFVLEGHPQFRYDLYSEYKANRIVKYASKKDELDKLHESKNIIVGLMQYLPVTIARAEHYECDDTIATLCENLKEENLTILSNDSDYIQLLQRGYNSIQIYNPIKKEFMAAPPYPYVAWKSLAGDKSDNIPPLVKPKKAIEYVSDPNSFKTFMDVEENRANFNINRQLIEFRMVPEEEIILQEGTRQFRLLKDSFTEMKFESLIKDKSWEKFTDTFNCLKY